MGTERLAKIDVFFRHVASVINGRPINPKNVAQVKRDFLQKPHNPTFEYKPLPKEIESLKAVLEVMQFKKNTIEQLYAKKRDYLLKEIKLKSSIGSEDLTTNSIELYAKPSKKLIRIATQILTLPISPKDDRILRKDAIILLKKAVAEIGIEWKVTSKKLVTSANVNTSEKKIEINKGERFGQNYIQRLAIHEIGTHVLRAENGSLQPYDMFRSGFANYLQTEEGLAAYNEFTYGFMTNTSLRNYAGRVLAISFALENDFATTFKLLRKYFDKNIALKLTIRSKRGLADTSKPGAYTKDCVYLRGFLEVLAFAKKDDVTLLYTGKIGIDDVEQVKKIKGLVKPIYTPHSLLEKEIIHPGRLQVDKKHVLSLLK